MFTTKKIYYLKNSGEVVWDVSYDTKQLVDLDVDYAVSTTLKQYEKSALDLLVISDGQYAQDFATCTVYRVNPETKELEFTYPDPNEPEVEQPYQAPLSEQIESLKQENKLLRAQNNATSERADFIEDIIAEMAMQVYQ